MYLFFIYYLYFIAYLWHIQVINKHNHLFTNRRPKHPFPPLLQPSINNILRHIRTRLRAKRQQHMHILLRQPTSQMTLNIHRLPRTRRPYKQAVPATQNQFIKQKAVSHGVHRLHNHRAILRLRVYAHRRNGVQPKSPPCFRNIERITVYRLRLRHTR